MNADPEVMEHFPSLLTREASDALIDAIKARFAEHGWGLWAVEVTKPAIDVTNPNFIGFVGLALTRFETPFSPCVEIGWRLARSAWGHGYATEAAKAVIQYAFEQIKLPELVSFTATCNKRSERVMQRLGMSHNPSENFDHPSLPIGHRLRRHVLYRLRNIASLPQAAEEEKDCANQHN
jgi:ribosomal-protein-alanine N-acetyltransferase